MRHLQTALEYAHAVTVGQALLPVDDDNIALAELENTVETAPLGVAFFARDIHLDAGAAALPFLEVSIVRAETVVVVPKQVD